MTTQEITNVSWNPGGDAPQMNNVLCPRCGEDCFNTWGLFEHLKSCTGTKRAPDDELVWVVVNGFDLALFPWEDAAEAVVEAEAILQEKDAKPGYGLEVDVLPWEMEAEEDATDDDPLGFSAMLDEYRAAHPVATPTAQQEAEFNGGWDLATCGRIPDHMTLWQRAGHDAYHERYAEEVAMERRMLGQMVNRGL